MIICLFYGSHHPVMPVLFLTLYNSSSKEGAPGSQEVPQTDTCMYHFQTKIHHMHRYTFTWLNIMYKYFHPDKPIRTTSERVPLETFLNNTLLPRFPHPAFEVLR